MNNLGSVLEQEGQVEEAGKYFQHAAAVRPKSAEIHMNLGCNLLLHGEYARGFAEYEWRRALADNPSRRNFGKPDWNGSDLTGRTILLHAEQGVGDTIQFARFLSAVAERGGKIVVECQAAIAPVIGGIAGVARTVAQGQPLGEFDVHFPLLSLPLAFGPTAQSVPGKVPYVFADERIVADWKSKIPAGGKTLRVGLAWAGIRSTRTIGFARVAGGLTPLGAVEGVSFFSLQKQADSLPESMRIVDWTAELTDYGEDGGVLSLLDLVICVDTSVAQQYSLMGAGRTDVLLRDDLVGIAFGVRAAILQIALVTVLDEVDGHPDGSATIGETVAELVDGLRFVQARQAQMVIRAVHGNVLGDVVGNAFMRDSKYSLPPTSRRYFVEKLQCMPDPFQSPLMGLQCSSTSTSYFSQRRIIK